MKRNRYNIQSNRAAFKITFIFPDFNYLGDVMSDYSGVFSLGIGYLSSTLKIAGFSTSLIHLTKHISQSDFISKVKKHNPSLIAFSFFSHQRKDVARYIGYIRDTGIETPIIIGGVHPTTAPEDASKIKGINYLCVGEGEFPILELCMALANNSNSYDDSHIPNIWKKDNNKWIKNDIRPLVQDLDLIPFPDRDLFNYASLTDSKLGVFEVISTRGCPYNCSYCCNHIYQRIYAGKGKYIRFRKIIKVIEEIKEGLKKFPNLKYVNLQDDAFCLDKNYVKEFCEKFKAEIGLKFQINTRVNLIDEDIVRYLSTGGCELIAIGVESGNPKIREEVLNRHMTNEQIYKCIQLCHKYNITVRTYNIVGLPFETIGNVLETIKLNAFSGADSYHVAIFQPYPNTKLYDICVDKGMISKNTDFKGFFEGYSLKQKSISETEVLFSYKFFYIYVRMYKIFGKLFPLAKLLDYFFTNRFTYTVQNSLYPLTFFMTYPILSSYRIMLKLFPRMTRLAKDLLYKKRKS